MDAELTSRMQIVQQAAALGAYIVGVDIAAMAHAKNIEPLRQALLTHHVVCIRNQQLSPDDHLSFSRQLGEIYIQPAVVGMQDYPEIVEVRGTHRLTESWHSDSTHSRRPPRYSILVARHVPPFGNDTVFANQHLAFESLSFGMQEMLQTLKATHRTAVVVNPINKVTGIVEESVHPVIRTHPDTGRKALFVNSQYTRHFDGMKENESAPLLGFLYDHASRAEFTWRHHWQSGDVLIWDNASVQHMVVGDLPKEAGRLMHRTTTLGDVPF